MMKQVRWLNLGRVMEDPRGIDFAMDTFGMRS